MKKMRKAYKALGKDLTRTLKRVAKKEKEMIVKFLADTRYEYIISFKEWKKGEPIVNGMGKVKVELRKDCCSVTKNGDYHLLFSDVYSIYSRNDREYISELLRSKMIETVLAHKCRCKKDQKKRAKAMICTAKRVNGRWVY